MSQDQPVQTAVKTPTQPPAQLNPTDSSLNRDSSDISVVVEEFAGEKKKTVTDAKSAYDLWSTSSEISDALNPQVASKDNSQPKSTEIKKEQEEDLLDPRKDTNVVGVQRSKDFSSKYGTELGSGSSGITSNLIAANSSDTPANVKSKQKFGKKDSVTIPLLQNNALNIPNADSKFIKAIDFCITAGTKADLQLAMDLIDIYLVTPGYDKERLIKFIRKHLASFLLNDAVSSKRENFLHLLVKTTYTEAEYDAGQSVVKLIVLLRKQYADIFNFLAMNADKKIPAQLVKTSTGNIYKAINENIISAPAADISNAPNYEEPDTWTVHASGIKSPELIKIIQDKVLEGQLNIAMSMMYSYLLDRKQDKAVLLAAIHKNLHIFLRSDAVSQSGYSILHLLAMFQGEYSLPAARIMETLFANFSELKNRINMANVKDVTPLHLAAYRNNIYAATVLKNRGAAHTLVGGAEKCTPEQVAIAEDRNKLDGEKDLTEIVTGNVAEDKKIKIEPMPNLFKAEKSDGHEIAHAIFQLLFVKQYQAAATALSTYLANKAYEDKFDYIEKYVKELNMTKEWKAFLEDPQTQDANNRNILSIFANGIYDASNASAALNILDSILAAKTDEDKQRMFAQKDLAGKTVLDEVKAEESSHWEYFTALFAKHSPKTESTQEEQETEEHFSGQIQKVDTQPQASTISPEDLKEFMEISKPAKRYKIS